MARPRTIILTPPRISQAHIREKISCIRAHRERIFHVSTTHYGTKLICHNYGHGGAGWTFLFGCVNESLRQFQHACIQHPTYASAPLAIIGAGCHGLLTAIMLARQGHRVRIIARDTTALPSYAAAGFFFPRARKSSTHDERELFERLGMESYATYVQIVQQKHPFITQGAQLLPAYYGCDIDPGFAPYIAHGLMQKPASVEIDFGNGKRYAAVEYISIFIDAVRMMDALHAEIKKQNITITSDSVDDFAEIPEQVIFNCAGRGAGILAADTRMVPVQGHLITLQQQPDTHHMQYMINMKVTQQNTHGRLRDELIYYAPKGAGLVGITFIRGQDSPTAHPHEFDRLLQRCIDFFGPYTID